MASDEEFGIGDLFREEVVEEKGGQTGGNRSVRSRLGMAPGFTRFDLEKFDGTGNFGLWQTRVKDILAQQGILKGLQETKPAKVDNDVWEDMQGRPLPYSFVLRIRSCIRSWTKILLREFGINWQIVICPNTAGQEAEKKKKKKMQCYRCKDWVHIKRECP